MKMSTKLADTMAPDNLPELADDFVPGDRDVVIGKGKKFYFHSGNQWLRSLVSSMIEEYSLAQTKSDKSSIISDVVEYIYQNGRFVKRDPQTGKWAHAEPLLCREKCSQTFRDYLAETYRSSNVAKRNKRRQEQQEKRQLMMVDPSSEPEEHMPQVKRMRLCTDTAAAPSTAAGSIPSQLFDLEMPLWSPKAKTVSMVSTNNLDLSSVPHPNLGAGMTETTAADNIDVLNGSMNFNFIFGGGAGSGAYNERKNSLNLLSDLFSQTVAAAHQDEQRNSFNPFEPTPLEMPPLDAGNGNTNNSGAAFCNNGHAFEPMLFQQHQQQSHYHQDSYFGSLLEPTPIQEQEQQQKYRRHSLAMFSDSADWFKSLTTEDIQDFTAKFAAAFAA